MKRNVENLVREAECGKAEVYCPPGEYHSQYELDDEFFHEVSHLDQSMISKIKKGNMLIYINFCPKKKFFMAKERFS